MIWRRRLAGILVAGALVASCQSEPPVSSVVDDPRFLDADGITIGGLLIFTNEEGVRSARLQFDTSYTWNDSTHTSLRGVDLTVFEEDGAERARVTSLRGLVDERWEGLVAQGNVVLVVPGEGRRLESEELHYDPEQGMIWSDSAFVMEYQGGTLRGTSFHSDVEFRNFRATGSGG